MMTYLFKHLTESNIPLNPESVFQQTGYLRKCGTRFSPLAANGDIINVRLFRDTHTPGTDG